MNVKRIFGGLCAVLLLFAPALTVSADETTAATTAEVIITPNPPTPTTTVPEVVITPNPPTVTTTTAATTTTTVPTTEATTEPDGEIGEPPVIPEWGEEDTTDTTETTETTTTTTTTTTIPTTVTLPTQTGEVLFPEYAERIDVITEPTMSDDKVYFYRENRKVNSTDFSWVPGRNGYAVQLDGETEYLRCATKEVQDLTEFTLSTWVNWQGGEPNQKLLTVYKNDNRFFSVSPNWDDESQSINGWYLEVRDRTIEPTVTFHPVRGGFTNALQANVWHHVAITVTDTAFILYVDGKAYLSLEYELSLEDMELSTFVIGSGFYGEKRLAALIDDAYLYTTALSPENVALLAADMNPVFGGSAPTTSVYYPTKPETTATLKPASGDVPTRGTIFGLPAALVLIPLGVVIAAVLLSLVLSKQKKQQPDWYEENEDDGSPTLEEPSQPTDEEEDE